MQIHKMSQVLKTIPKTKAKTVKNDFLWSNVHKDC